MMSGRLKQWLVFALFLGTAVYALAEDITLTTYYPSPRGVYQELRTAGDMVVGNIATAPGARLHVIQDDPASAVPVFRADDETSETSPFLIDANGNVGIGTTDTTTQKLHVSGNARIEGTVSAQAFGSLSPLRFEIAGVEHMRITDTGDVGIGTVTPAGKLDVAGTAALRGAAGQTGLVVNNAGQVGIGTSTPNVSLDVNGAANVSGVVQIGTLSVDPALGSDGMVYYNSTDGAFRGFQDGAWSPLGSSSGAPMNVALANCADVPAPASGGACPGNQVQAGDTGAQAGCFPVACMRCCDLVITQP